MGIEVSKIQAVIFDIDGTLSDSDDLIVARLADKLEGLLFLRHAEKRRRFARWLVMRV